MSPRDLDSQLDSLVLLDDSGRRRLYLHVVAQGTEVGRDEAAQATGLTRSLAAFHLDKLVEAGLLEVSYRRLGARTGRGAGRPAKLYRRAARQIDVTLPERRYEMAAQILARALVAADGATARSALLEVARWWGHRLAAEAGQAGTGDMAQVLRGLQSCGYEPQRGPDGEVRLRNCPFEALRGECSTTICSMNLPLIEGLLEGLGATEIEARLVPHTEFCCVRLRGQPPANHGAAD